MDEADKPITEVYFFWIDRALKAQRKATNKLFKKLELNITADQWIILKRLREVENSTQIELAKSVYKDPASLTRILDLLEKEQFIARERLDRRSFKIVLSDSGKRLVDKIIPEAVKYRKIGLKGVSNEELNTLKKVLNQISENFEIDQ